MTNLQFRILQEMDREGTMIDRRADKKWHCGETIVHQRTLNQLVENGHVEPYWNQRLYVITEAGIKAMKRIRGW